MGNGLIGDCIDTDDVMKGIQFVEGTVFGLQHDPVTHSVACFHNNTLVGSCIFKQETAEKMQTLYPLFALYVPQQRIEVEFNKPCPADVTQPVRPSPLEDRDRGRGT